MMTHEQSDQNSSAKDHEIFPFAIVSAKMGPDDVIMVCSFHDASLSSVVHRSGCKPSQIFFLATYTIGLTGFSGRV
jgi:hypothetical protein